MMQFAMLSFGPAFSGARFSKFHALWDLYHYQCWTKHFGCVGRLRSYAEEALRVCQQFNRLVLLVSNDLQNVYYKCFVLCREVRNLSWFSMGLIYWL